MLGVPALAHEVLGRDLKLIYIVRDPVDRIVSQYVHEFSVGLVKEPIDEAIVKYARYVDTSCYYLQLQEWLRVFPHSNVLLLKFEDYFANREAEYAKVCRFLGATSEGTRLDIGRAANARHSEKRVSGMLRELQGLPTYRKARLYFPTSIRGVPGQLVRWLFGRTPSVETTLSCAVRRYLAYRIGPDLDAFEHFADFAVEDWREALAIA